MRAHGTQESAGLLVFTCPALATQVWTPPLVNPECEGLRPASVDRLARHDRQSQRKGRLKQVARLRIIIECQVNPTYGRHPQLEGDCRQLPQLGYTAGPQLSRFGFRANTGRIGPAR